jgi:hypothetical protein
MIHAVSPVPDAATMPPARFHSLRANFFPKQYPIQRNFLMQTSFNPSLKLLILSCSQEISFARQRRNS